PGSDVVGRELLVELVAAGLADPRQLRDRNAVLRAGGAEGRYRARVDVVELDGASHDEAAPGGRPGRLQSPSARRQPPARETPPAARFATLCSPSWSGHGNDST